MGTAALLISRRQAEQHCWQLATADNGRPAVATWIFNLGAGSWRSSTFRRLVQAGGWQAAVVKGRRWVHGGCRRLPGLVLRREAEVALNIERG